MGNNERNESVQKAAPEQFEEAPQVRVLLIFSGHSFSNNMIS